MKTRIDEATQLGDLARILDARGIDGLTAHRTGDRWTVRVTAGPHDRTCSDRLLSYAIDLAVRIVPAAGVPEGVSRGA